MLSKVPGYLADPLGPLRIRWSYLPALTPWLARLIRAGTPARIEAQARALTPLLAPCLETVMELARYAGAESLVARNGILIAYRTQAAWEADQRAWDLRRRNGIPGKNWMPTNCASSIPTCRATITRGKLVPGNGHSLNPGGFVAVLAQAVQRDGGHLLRRRATGFALDGARLRAVHTPEGEVLADAAVIAAGAFSRRLAASVGDRVPLETERGYHLMLRDPEVMPRVPTTDADAKFVATPMAGGLRFAGRWSWPG